MLVDADDPAFAAPTKPIGPGYSEQEARELAAARGWTIGRDGEDFRRVVPSPEPRDIVELQAIERLLAAGAVVVCAGGGGIPVVKGSGATRGVEAVIDKDLTAALLAVELAADKLLLLTDVRCVERNWGLSSAAPIDVATPEELRRLSFAEGSMKPKVEAACRFVERTGREAAIGSLFELEAVASGRAGTRIAAEAIVAA